MVFKKVRVNRCALLDADFVSKLYTTKVDDSDRLIYRIVCIDEFHFVCHYQTVLELSKYDLLISNWIKENEKITVYTDCELLCLLIAHFGQMAYGQYLNMLKISCDTSSSNYFTKYYISLEEYLIKNWLNWYKDEFLSLLKNVMERLEKIIIWEK